MADQENTTEKAFIALIRKQFGMSEAEAIAAMAQANQRDVDMADAIASLTGTRPETEGYFTPLLLEEIQSQTKYLEFRDDGLAWSWAGLPDEDPAEVEKQGEAAILEYLSLDGY